MSEQKWRNVTATFWLTEADHKEAISKLQQAAFKYQPAHYESRFRRAVRRIARLWRRP